MVGVPWETIEKRAVTIRWCTQHGDFHPGNVLVGRDYTPTLIDFGRVGRAPASLDPLTLELSLLFHPDFRTFLGNWPTKDSLEHWSNVKQYVADCPCGIVV